MLHRKPTLTNFAQTLMPVLLATLLSSNQPAAAAFDGQAQVPDSAEQQSAGRQDKVKIFSHSPAKSPVVIAWQAQKEKAVLIAIHGFGLHKYAFKQFGEAMQKRGISTYALDVRGFGGWTQSREGRRLSFKATFQDLADLIESLKKEAPERPIFLMGESMGGAIALHFAAEHPHLVDGLIASVPSAERYKAIQTTVRIASSFILNVGGDINVSNLIIKRASEDLSLQKAWRDDEQAKLKVSLSEILRLNGFMKGSHRLVKRLDVPVLLVQGEKDHLVKPAGIQKLFAELASPDKQLLMLKDGEHLTFEEGQCNEQVIARVDKWIENHISRNEIIASSTQLSATSIEP